MRFTPTRALAMLIVAFAAALIPVAEAIKLPRPLPDITIPTTDGKKIRLLDYRGKPLAILLFSTQCSDCLKSIDLLNRLQKVYGPQGFQAIGVAVNVDAPDQIKAFVDRYRPLFPMGHLAQQEMLKITDIGPKERPYVPIFIFV